MVVPLMSTLSMSKEPPEIKPVVVMVLEPMQIAPPARPPVAVRTPVTPSVPLMVTPSEQLVVTMSIMPVLPEASKLRAEATLSVRSISVAALRVMQPPPMVKSVTDGEAVQAGIQDPPIDRTVLAAPFASFDKTVADEA